MTYDELYVDTILYYKDRIEIDHHFPKCSNIA